MPTVLVINSDHDLINTLSSLLEDHGMHVVPVLLPDIQQGRIDFITLIAEQQPDAVVVDVPPPYVQNWNFNRLLRCVNMLAHIPTIYITTNKRALERAVGVTEAIALLDMPFDADEILHALDVALKLRNLHSITDDH